MSHRFYMAVVTSMGVFLLLAAVPANAEVVAEFNGGGSNAAPVVDVPDAYYGMVGDGWATEWIESISSTVTYTVTTENSNPLGVGTGNYLNLVADSGGTGKGASVGRSWTDGVDLAMSHTIEFKYRVDEDITGANTTFTNSNDRYQLFDQGYERTTANGDTSWLVGCYGGELGGIDPSKVGKWVVYNGENNNTAFDDAHNLSTGITVTPGTTYDFRIDVNAEAKTWNVTIGVDGTVLYDSTQDPNVVNPNGLGWRTASETVGGRLTFGSYSSASNDFRMYSIDSIHVSQVPEPSTLAMLMALVAAGFWAFHCSRR
ncbi:MAG: PEP-CTERM sorting domain-containing protein [Pirellulales bacterium]|nr:PEP-CTERM sorting domain-containing protein [Pirellulales bacterium]